MRTIRNLTLVLLFVTIQLTGGANVAAGGTATLFSVAPAAVQAESMSCWADQVAVWNQNECNERRDFHGECAAGTCWDAGMSFAIGECDKMPNGYYWIMVGHFCGMWDPEPIEFSCQRLCWD